MKKFICEKSTLPVFDVTIEEAAKFLSTSNLCLNRRYCKLSDIDLPHVYDRKNSGYLEPKTGEGCRRIWEFSKQLLESDEQYDMMLVEKKSFEKEFRSPKKGKQWRESLLNDYSMNVLTK